jgi:hypothetical protein
MVAEGGLPGRLLRYTQDARRKTQDPRLEESFRMSVLSLES